MPARTPTPPGPGRRAFSVPAGSAVLSGERGAARRLEEAIAVPPPAEQYSTAERELVEASLSVHLFHGFAARTHPLSVRRLLADCGPGMAVLDPFCGSGTTLVEAALRGARGCGVDLGELPVRLSRFKATPIGAERRAAIGVAARAVAAASEERVRERRRPKRDHAWDAAHFYEPHVYLELCGLREEIGAVAEPGVREALLLAFSALVLKFSRQRSETRAEPVRRALGKLAATRFFLRKAEEMLRLHAAFAARVPPATPPPELTQGDAREVRFPGDSADVVVTSPPYLGVYDYAAHHARRCAWLDIDLRALQDGEIAARRNISAAPAPVLLSRYQRDSERWLSRVTAALRPRAPAYVFIGDPSLPGGAPSGDLLLRAAAARVGLHFVASCSVERAGGRREHLLHFHRPSSRSS